MADIVQWCGVLNENVLHRLKCLNMCFTVGGHWLGRFRRYGFAGENMSLGTSSDVSKLHASLRFSLFIFCGSRDKLSASISSHYTVIDSCPSGL